MAKRTPKKIQDLSGLFIYQDPKNGTIFYDIFTKKAFYLTSSDLKPCLTYTLLFPLALAISLMLASFSNLSVKLTVCICIGGYLLAEILYRPLYFYKLPVAENWKPIKRDNFLISFAKKYSPQRLIVLMILMVIIAVCTIVYGKMENSALVSLTAGYIMSAVCVGFALFCLIALAIRKKNNY